MFDMRKLGFDSNRYMQLQKEAITKRIASFGNKLYLEFGGKLFDDLHAARVLPGFDPNAKIKLLQNFADIAEIIFCINASDIEHQKIRADFNITYDQEVLRLIDKLREAGLYVSSIVITHYTHQPSVDHFRQMLAMRQVQTYLHYPIEGYPTNIEKIVSEEGYGLNDYVPTTRPLVVITAPGPCSGKLATCLSQLYHENKRGNKAGYAKFETFPVWNLPLKHPVNLAYEAATADLRDVNMIDPFHLDAYEKAAVNYNRDIEVFPIVRTILEKIMQGSCPYQSPTDMGVNMVGYGICDDEIVCRASRQEILRRYFQAQCDYKLGRADIETVQKIETIMKELSLSVENRRVCIAARKVAEETDRTCMALELPDGNMIYGKTSDRMENSASTILNAIKACAHIQDDMHLLSPIVLEPMLNLCRHSLGEKSPILNLREVLIALSICAATNPIVETALKQLDTLRGCEAHSSCLLSQDDEQLLKRLGIHITCDANYARKEQLYQR